MMQTCKTINELQTAPIERLFKWQKNHLLYFEWFFDSKRIATGESGMMVPSENSEWY